MIRLTLSGMAARLLVVPEKPVYVDLDDALRKHALREAEYQARADEQSRILRISGRRKFCGPLKRIRAV